MLKEKERLMREYSNDIRLREGEIESMRITYEEELAKKEREKAHLKTKYDETYEAMAERLHSERRAL